MKNVYILELKQDKFNFYSKILNEITETKCTQFKNESDLVEALPLADKIDFIIFDIQSIQGDFQIFLNHLNKERARLKFESLILTDKKELEDIFLAMKNNVYAYLRNYGDQLDSERIRKQFTQLYEGHGLFPGYNV